MNRRQKIYCYVDETGQDDTSEYFIVVAVVNDDDQDAVRKALLEAEQSARTGARKWHKSARERRLAYLDVVLKKHIAAGGVYFGRYGKPLPYFLPILDTMEKAINAKASKDYRAIVMIDGVDKKKAAEFTNALRLRKIRLDFVRGRRDESEPLIRLADMWAGCVRAAFFGEKEAKARFAQALQDGYLFEVSS
jgi:Protein of unknown function (DUF3800)